MRKDLSQNTRLSRPIPLDEPFVGEEEIANLTECIRSGWLSWQGRFVGEFEKKFAAYCGTKFAVTTGSGTAALMFSLQALGIKPGDEVIVPTLTFSAPVYAISLLGAVPVFADNQPDRFSVDTHEIKRRITPRTKAIIAVHLYGYPVEMDAILKIARPAGVKVIEDAAEAVGAECRGRKVGSFGDVGCFSFHNKHIGTGEGGIVTLNHKKIAQRLIALKNPAPNNDTNFPEISVSLRMSNLNAAVGVAQLERLETIIERKREVARFYEESFKGWEWLKTIPQAPLTRSVYWRYSVRVSDGAQTRDQLVKFLNQAGIQARSVFVPMHRHPYYQGKRAASEDFPNAVKISDQGVDLPTSAKLTRDDQKYIIKIMSRFSPPLVKQKARRTIPSTQ